MIIALDPGLRTGWAISDGTSGVIDLSLFQDHGQAAAFFHDWLDAQFTAREAVYLAVESHYTSFRRRDQYASLTEWLCGIAHMVAYSHGVPRYERGATSIRSWLTGNGKAKDPEVIAACNARGFYPQTPHAADACALLLCSMDLRMKQQEFAA